jgi:2-keto-3-deoxy-L-fuconate dehydrogenase
VFQLTGKAAVVTGGGSGIGAAIALFARQGAHVTILDLDGHAARRTADLIRRDGAAAEAVACDVTSAVRVRETIGSVAAARARLDILVNNAGIAHVGTIERTDEADLDRLCPIDGGVLVS